jgi:hypothetical protein
MRFVVENLILGQGFLPVTSVFPCQQRSTDAPYDDPHVTLKEGRTGEAGKLPKSEALLKIGHIIKKITFNLDQF